MFATNFVLLSSVITLIDSASVTGVIQLSNTTNTVNRYAFGMNLWTGDNNLEFTGNYTIIRNGGETQSRFNWEINALNSCKDWYFISNGESFTWEQQCDATVKANADLFMQIPALGWVAKSRTKSWSYSQAKYGEQTADECTASGDATWCAKDAGNGIWASNNSQVTGNDFTDADIQTTPNDAYNWTKAIIAKYGSKATVFGIDNEPGIWHQTHRDVHPIGCSYDELFNKTRDFGSAIKTACNKECSILGPTVCCWCPYFTSGLDVQNGNCYTGKDREAHNNLTVLQYYLQQSALFEKQNGYRLLDYLDVHYYPAAANVNFNCDETNVNTTTDRLQAPRSLYDWNYVDPSWINQPIALIPRIRGWIDEYYPNTKFSISEYNFGGDTCITSAIAHSEVLAIFGTYGVSLGTRWSKPKPNAFVTNSFNIFMNYDNKGSSIFSNDNSVTTKAFGTKTSDIETATIYGFYTSDMKHLYVYMFNKAKSTTQLTVNLEGGNSFTTTGEIDLYGIDQDKGINFIGPVYNKPSSSSFVVSMPQWTVRLAIINA